MLAVFTLCLFEFLWCLSDLIMKPRQLSCDKIFKNEASAGRFDEAAYRATGKRNFRIRSDYGYIISCELLIPAKQDRNGRQKLAILCHGLGITKYGGLKYAELFLRLGYMVLLYDQRNHGLSGGGCTSMGHYEKHDLKRLVDWCMKHFGEDSIIITHGESMGAATVLMHLEIDQRVKCVIADCSYSDLIQLLKHQLREYYHLPYWLIPIESSLTYLRAGFHYHDISPIRVISNCDIPVLFIHGKKDNFVPTYMSRQLYQAKKRNKALYLVADAKHAECICKNREGYRQRVEEFLRRYSLL